MSTISHPWPGLAPITQAYLREDPEVCGLFGRGFREERSFLDLAGEIRTRAFDRPGLVEVLKEQNQAFGNPVEGRIEKLLRDETCTVVTGQQVGLFGGPLFTIYKAITAVHLCEWLSRHCQHEFMPVFWMATDDHDFSEADHIWYTDKAGVLRNFAIPAGRAGERTPVFMRCFEGDMAERLEMLKSEFPDSEFKEDIFAELAAAYASGHSLTGAFGRWMARLLGQYGIILIDPSDPRLKAMARGLFEREIVGHSPSSTAALAASERLQSLGYDPALRLNSGVLNLFLIDDAQRKTIEVRDGTFRIKSGGQLEPAPELTELVATKPDRLSPNVVLRPLYQDSILPNVCYVAGPAEISYFAQLGAVYEAFDIPMPAIYPRKSLTLIDPGTERLLEKYELDPSDCWRRKEVLLTEVSRRLMPDSMEAVTEETVRQMETAWEQFRQRVTAFDPSMDQPLQSALARIRHQLAGVEKKVVGSYKRRNETVTRHLERLSIQLYPKNQLQERVFNILPFLVRHGWSVVDRIHEGIDIFNFQHQFVKVR